MENLVNYALAYADHGFSVLPMINKKPLIKFANQPALTPHEIRSIWRSNPYANIAVKTDEFLVVDIDRHAGGVDGIKTYDQLPKKYFPKTLAQKTAHNGYQLFYKKREDMTVHQLIGWQPGIDIKAHKNNYVLIAPSAIDGQKYQWINKLPMVEAPLELITNINQMRATNHKYVLKDNFHAQRQRNSTTDVLEVIAFGLGDEGKRNQKLVSLIGALFFRAVEPSAVYQLAMMANQNTPNPLPEPELNRTFKSMLEREEGRRSDG